MLIRSYRDSDAWRAAHEFTLQVYRLTASFPRDELYGLTSQLRRSASSVASNLAEGFGRRSKNELGRYCRIANGSLQEASYQLLLAKDLGYCAPQEHDELGALSEKAGALIGGLERSLRVTRPGA